MASGSSLEGTRNPIKIFANIFISFIGAGILGLPYGFKEAGLMEAFLIMLFVGVISIKAMLLLIDCKYRIIDQRSSNGRADNHQQTQLMLNIKDGINSAITDSEVDVEFNSYGINDICFENMTYGDVGFIAVGSYGRIIVEVCVVLSQVGFCCAYLIFIAENFNKIFMEARMLNWLVILLPPLFCLTLFRHLGKLAYTSLLAQCSSLLAFAVVFWFDLQHIYRVRFHPDEFRLSGIPFFFAIAVYCFEGAGLILSLEGSLARDIRPRFNYYFKITISIVVILYIAFGACGYLSFGHKTNPIITLNLPGSAGVASLVSLCLSLAQFFTYPLMMFPVLQILEQKLLPTGGKELWQGNILRFLLVCLTGLVVLAIPSFSALMALIGSTCCMLLGFILPGIFHASIFRHRSTVYDRCIDYFMIFLGFACMIFGTYDTIKRIYLHHAADAGIIVESINGVDSHEMLSFNTSSDQMLPSDVVLGMLPLNDTTL